MYFDGLADLKAYAKEFGERQFITKGFLCCRTDDDDIIITKPNTNLLKVKDSDFDEISSETLEAVDLSYRAAAVVLAVALKRKENYCFAAIVDSPAILEYSKKGKSLSALNDSFTQLCGIKAGCTRSNVGSEIVARLHAVSDVCIMNNAGALITGRTIEELYKTAEALDLTCNIALTLEKNNLTRLPKYRISGLEYIGHKIAVSALVSKERERRIAERNGKTILERESAIQTAEEEKTAKSMKKLLSDLYSEKLVLRNIDSVANRMGDGRIVLTANDTDNKNATIEDFTIVDLENKTTKARKKTTSYKRLHLATFINDADISTTIYAHPYYSVILGNEFDTVEVPEKYREILGDKIDVIKESRLNSNKMIKDAVYALGSGKICILKHRGIFVKAKDNEEGLRLVQTMEKMAEEHYKE